MDVHNDVVLEVEKDLDNDRYLTYDQFKDLINWFPKFDRRQCFFLLLGLTGFRPCEVSKLTLDQLEFSNRSRPVIRNRIMKSKTYVYYDKFGHVKSRRVAKIKRRQIPLWVRDYVEHFIRLEYNKFQPDNNGSFYLFSSPSRRCNISVKSWNSTVNKLRKKLYLEDPVKWSWVNEKVSEKIVMDKKVFVHRLCLYSFRKSRATWYGMQLMDKGISDVLLNVSHFMGHSKVNTTYTYLKALVAENHQLNPEPIAPPDLTQNIFRKKSEEEIEIDKAQNMLCKLTEDVAFLKQISNLIKQHAVATKK